VNRRRICKGVGGRRNPMTGTLLLAGVSARMLAELATKAGYSVVALDYFGDADLRACCPSTSILRDLGGRYSAAALADAAQNISAEAVVYGASFENHPEQVARLAQGRRLLGNSPEVLARARDPSLLADALGWAGLAMPETLVAEAASRADRSRRWLVKPRRSGGGHGVRRWRGGPLGEHELLQEQIAGSVCSASFVADGERALLLGLTRQIVGRKVFGARRFRYCGNYLPPRPKSRRAMLEVLPAALTRLTRRLGLRGLNGIDFVDDGRRLWAIEVNPRPTAALELIDEAYGLRVFDAHVRAFRGELPDFELGQAIDATPTLGKAIVYAEQDVTLGDTGGWAARGRRDIPHAGEAIRKGQPICTLLVSGPSLMACEIALKTQAIELKMEIYG
jgi:uncharacterized protein